MEDVEAANAGLTLWLYMGIPRFSSSWTESGDVALLAAVVADDLVDLYYDVFGNLGVNGFAIDHLGEGNALVVVLCNRYLAEHLILVGNDYANDIARYIRFP